MSKAKIDQDKQEAELDERENETDTREAERDEREKQRDITEGKKIYSEYYGIQTYFNYNKNDYKFYCDKVDDGTYDSIYESLKFYFECECTSDIIEKVDKRNMRKSIIDKRESERNKRCKDRQIKQIERDKRECERDKRECERDDKDRLFLY